MTLLITGGLGFIGSNYVLNKLSISDEIIINIDKMTYASNVNNLESVKNFKNYFFYKHDIQDSEAVAYILKKYKPRALINFAAESHVDSSIKSPKVFFESNILGTFNLLEETRKFLSTKCSDSGFKFIQISTDEVYGSLKVNEKRFNEKTKYKPNSPYSASKASSDLIVRSYVKTFNLPCIITHCSNNFGPNQNKEKFIPNLIRQCLNNEKFTIYGDGTNIRDWLYVDDHINAINLVLECGKIGEIYDIGGNEEKSNLEIVNLICQILDKAIKNNKENSFSNLINFVKDRPGHDFRYSINSSKIKKELKWRPKNKFLNSLKFTIEWYIKNQHYLN